MFYLSLMEIDPTLPRDRRKARGAAHNPANRFDRHQTVPVDDGWARDEDDDLPPLRTETTIERPRSVIAWNGSPDLGFDRAINPYRGCEHGCIYCYARPSHAYLGLSAGLDFETRLIARPDAAAVLEKELGKRGYRVRPMALGSNTDPWQPIEKQHAITRSLLQVLNAWNHPVTITTRGALIERDIDILAEMAQRNLVEVGVSITTLDPGLARSMEPRAPAPARRLAVMRRLSDAGIPTRLMMAPVIPGLTDPEIEAIMTAARDAGARVAWFSLLRLPREVAGLFQDWLTREHPLAAAKVMARLRAMRAGAENDSTFYNRFRGTGPTAELIAQRVALARKRLGYSDALPDLDCTRFAPPPRAGDQLSLF